MNSSDQSAKMIEYISGKDHYDNVIGRVASVRKSLWIGTADIKDLHVKAGNKTISRRSCRFAETRRRDTPYPCQRTGSGVPRRFRPLSNSKERVGADALPESTLQDADLRLRDSLYRLRQFDRSRHRHEKQ